MHPEIEALIPYCEKGTGIDVGCGSQKIHENCIGVDIIPKGGIGKVGIVRNKRSVADVCASGDDLHMFKTGTLDFVVSRHNLEHYINPFKALREWKRVLRIGGFMAVIVPDEENFVKAGRGLTTLELDPSHRQVFTMEGLQTIVYMLNMKIIKTEIVVPNWSFIIVAVR